jgi:hypothetical protein
LYCRQALSLPHILVELFDLGFDLPVWLARLSSSAARPQGRRQMNQRRPGSRARADALRTTYSGILGYRAQRRLLKGSGWAELLDRNPLTDKRLYARRASGTFAPCGQPLQVVCNPGGKQSK